MTGYHVTPRRNRLAISRWGLIPRDTGDHWYEDAWMNRGVEAVYVHTDAELARNWRDTYGHEYGAFGNPDEGYDIWQVDASGLEMEPDPYAKDTSWLRSSVRVLERVGPDRLQLVQR